MESSLPGSAFANDGEILIFAPTGNDGPLTAAFLMQAHKRVRVCREMAEVCLAARHGCQMILLAEETLNSQSIKMLGEMLAAQPPWSDIPIAVITSGGDASTERLQILTSLGMSANVGLLERPFRRGTLVSAIEVASRPGAGSIKSANSWLKGSKLRANWSAWCKPGRPSSGKRMRSSRLSSIRSRTT